jgi:hypothetical protein
MKPKEQLLLLAQSEFRTLGPCLRGKELVISW